jgi:hypothetical protein
LPNYLTFGGSIRSEHLLFPELPVSSGERTDWSLRVAAEPSSENVGELLGAWPDSYCNIGLYRLHNGFRLRHSCTGEFDISEDGSELTWYPPSDANLEMVRSDILGRVMAVAIHAAGGLTLHGSAVAIGQGVVAFLAPKHHGKSTLAAALIRGGAQLVTDDIVAIDLQSTAQVRSGVHSMRLCSDSAERLIEQKTPRRFGVDGKHVVDHTGPDAVMLGVAPLSAIYVLRPISGDPYDSAATRRQLSSTQAAMTLLSHGKISPLLGKAEAGAVFERAVTLASHVPVYGLDVIRDFDRMDEVVGTIMSWHQASLSVVA